MRFDSCGAAINGLGFRDREDELRAKQLEQEIAEGRRRRQALRQRQRRPDSVDETNHDAGKKEREIQNTMDTLVGTTERMKLTGGLNEQKSTKPLDESTSSERPTADNKKPAPPPLKSKPSLEALEGHPHLRPKTSSEGISSKKDIPPAVKSKPAGLEPKSKSSVEDLKSRTLLTLNSSLALRTWIRSFLFRQSGPKQVVKLRKRIYFDQSRTRPKEDSLRLLNPNLVLRCWQLEEAPEKMNTVQRALILRDLQNIPQVVLEMLVLNRILL